MPCVTSPCSRPVREPNQDRLRDSVKSWRCAVSGDISHDKRVRLQKDERVTVRGRTVTFQFVNHGGLDGVNFSAECQVQLCRLAGGLEGGQPQQHAEDRVVRCAQPDDPDFTNPSWAVSRSGCTTRIGSPLGR